MSIIDTLATLLEPVPLTRTNFTIAACRYYAISGALGLLDLSTEFDEAQTRQRLIEELRKDPAIIAAVLEDQVHATGKSPYLRTIAPAQHICGLQGYNGMIDPPCAACNERGGPLLTTGFDEQSGLVGGTGT